MVDTDIPLIKLYESVVSSFASSVHEFAQALDLRQLWGLLHS
jgi:hypothetical protein